jgi:bifunctional non-homologous end joining protein LigD
MQGQELVIGGYTAPRQSRTEAGTLLVGYHQRGALLHTGKLDITSDQNLLRDLGARLRG